MWTDTLKYPKNAQLITPSAVNVAANTTGLPCPGHVPLYGYPWETGAPPRSIRETAVANKRKAAVPSSG